MRYNQITKAQKCSIYGHDFMACDVIDYDWNGKQVKKLEVVTDYNQKEMGSLCLSSSK